ncbi:GNAT family protein [Kitasatospora sp. NPDC097643]|uniref:GNAT family N-acetyltransferase n=1 Tax=Kitasatospora sp. NPDC097643 TaxID=3157230 RepID=UPI0033202202
MSTDSVFLRPFTASDVAHLDALIHDPEAVGPFQWYGWHDPARFRRRWAENGLLADGQSMLAVVADGGFAGFVAWRPLRGAGRTPYWSLGAQLRPEARGRGIGTRAQLLLVEYLFAHTTVMRLEADTDTANHAEQRALEKCGFTREGVQRSATFRDGAWRDLVRYGLLRTDPRPGPA